MTLQTFVGSFVLWSDMNGTHIHCPPLNFILNLKARPPQPQESREKYFATSGLQEFKITKTKTTG